MVHENMYTSVVGVYPIYYGKGQMSIPLTPGLGRKFMLRRLRFRLVTEKGKIIWTTTQPLSILTGDESLGRGSKSIGLIRVTSVIQ